MPAKAFVDTNIWLYSLIQNDDVAGDARHGMAFAFLASLSRPVLNSQAGQLHEQVMLMLPMGHYVGSD
jgi:predicted nucleic acid-binding protein